MANLTNAELQALWIAAGGDPSWASTMAAVAQAESDGGDPNIVNNTAGEGGPYEGVTGSYGLWQINCSHVESLGVAWFAMSPAIPFGKEGDSNGPWSVPIANAQAAVMVFNSQGAGAWTTYKNGAYKKYLSGGSTPNPVNTGIAGTGIRMAVDLTGTLFQQYESLLRSLDPIVLALIVCAGLMIFSLMGWSNKFASYAAVIIFILLMIRSSAQNGTTPNGTSPAAIPPASQITQPKISFQNVVASQTDTNSGSSSSGDPGIGGILSWLF